MAGACGKTKGYQVELVTPEIKEGQTELHYCEKCKLLPREATITKCCEKYFCKACLDSIFGQASCGCPICGKKAEFCPVPQSEYREVIAAIEVYCDKKQNGCEWRGELGHLESHLISECNYVEIDCPQGCESKVLRFSVNDHITNDCPNRECSCKYCSFKSTFQVVHTLHMPNCVNYPIQCPHKCGIKFKRKDLQQHLTDCMVHTIECPLKYAGCTATFKRQDEGDHMERNVGKHMAMLADQNRKMQKEIEMQTKKIEALSRKLHDKDVQMQEMKTSLEQQVKLLTGVPPFEFRVTDFKMKKEKNAICYGPVIHVHGYRFQISVRPNGYNSGIGKSVGMWLRAVKGDYDAKLKWPLKVTISLQITNQHHDGDHECIQEIRDWYRPKENSECVGGPLVEFPHEKLNLNLERKTQYLKDDCLVLCITKIEFC